MKKASYTDSLKAQEALFLIETDPLLAKEKFEKYLKEYPLHHFAHVQYASCLIVLGEFEKSLKVLEDVEKSYRNIDKDLDYIEDMEIDIVDVRLKALCYLGRYSEFFECYNANRSKTTKERIHSALFYCKRHAGMLKPLIREGHSYINSQIIEYRKSDFYYHIKSHLASSYESLNGNEKSVFMPDFPLDDVLKEIYQSIPSNKKICTDFFADVYYFKYDNCGFGENGKIVDYIKVICLHGTKNILTMYPTNEHKKSLYMDISISKTNNDYITQLKNKTIAPGDLVMIKNETYIVRKVISDKELSLLKITPDGEVKFKYKDFEYRVAKNAVISDDKNITILQKLGTDVLKEFEKAKKAKPQKTKTVVYKEGDVLIIDDKQVLVIDAQEEDYLIILDENQQVSCITRHDAYKIRYSISKFEVNCVLSDIDYSEDYKKKAISKVKSSNKR